MSIPRNLSLKTVGGKVTLVQSPRENWSSIVSNNGFDQSWLSIQEGATSLGSVGMALQIDLSFSDREPAALGSSEFGIAVRATPDSTQQTQVGYDFAT
jgi:sucrose-6-phosphate hydrolase SacC (GH32 family)